MQVGMPNKIKCRVGVVMKRQPSGAAECISVQRKSSASKEPTPESQSKKGVGSAG